MKQVSLSRAEWNSLAVPPSGPRVYIWIQNLSSCSKILSGKCNVYLRHRDTGLAKQAAPQGATATAVLWSQQRRCQGNRLQVSQADEVRWSLNVPPTHLWTRVLYSQTKRYNTSQRVAQGDSGETVCLFALNPVLEDRRRGGYTGAVQILWKYWDFLLQSRKFWFESLRDTCGRRMMHCFYRSYVIHVPC